MKNLIYIPFALILFLTVSCSMQNNGVKATDSGNAQPALKEFGALIRIKDTIKLGDSVLLTFFVYNQTDSVKRFLKWQTPFEPLISKYLEIKNESGEEVNYKGPMAKRMMPPPASSYITLNPKDSLVAIVDILKGYELVKPGKYTVNYTSENISGLIVRQQASFIYR